jgi:mevalonate kinase
VPTPEVIAEVERRRRAQPRVYDALFDAIEACTLAAAEAIERADWATVGALMDVAQGLMVALRVSTPRLDAIVQDLRAQPGVLGAKISGAGLGDCAIALGEVADRALAPIRIEVASKGVQVDAR